MARQVPEGIAGKSAIQTLWSAVRTYVEEHGGKIDTIKVNGTAQTITDKTVNITVPQGTVTTTGTMNANHVVTSNGGTVIKDSGYTIATSVPSGAVFTDTNQTVKGNGTAFGASAAVNIVPGSNVTVTADTTNNKITIAATDTNTDEKVKSAASTTNVDEPILLNNGTSGTTNTVLFKSGATINPSTGNLNITKINGVTVGSSPKFTDTDTNQTIKGNGTAFGTNDAVDIVAGSNVTVTADATNKKITISSTDTNTDEKVKSAASTTNTNYPILLNNGTSAATSTVLFKSGATINPSTGNLAITQINGVTVGNSPKFTDTTYGDASTSAKGIVQLSSSTSSTSTTLAATASAVKSAYDLANGKAAKPDLGTFTWPSSFSDVSNHKEATITISGATVDSNSKIDIQPSIEQINTLQGAGCTSCMIVNNSGTIKLCIIGDSPSSSEVGSVQVCVTQVTQ